MDVLIHVANVLFLLSYSVRDILWLRLLTVVAIISLLPYYASNDLYPPIKIARHEIGAAHVQNRITCVAKVEDTRML